MLRHLGYLAETQSLDACTHRTCRPHDATPARLRTLVAENLRDLGRILRFNAEHGVAFYRVSSRVVPFAAHPDHDFAWWDEFSGELEELGQFVGQAGLRLEMDPGRLCLLNAPSPETVALSILELGWHVRFLDALQLDASHKLVIRVGGSFGDRSASFGRFLAVINGLPGDWKSRLVIENDASRRGLAEVLDASRETGLPVAVGWRSHRPEDRDGREPTRLLARAFDTWRPVDGAPIVHLGSPPPPLPGRAAMADWADPEALETLIGLAPPAIPFDCLLEAAQGDRALFDLRERLATRESGHETDRLAAVSAPIA